jgi:pimeloyl-ACP methyl ester carboxylesterase
MFLRNQSRLFLGMLTIATVLVAFVTLWRTGRTPSKTSLVASSVSLQGTATDNQQTIRLATTTGGLAYFSCPSSRPSLILLHGTAFTKEDWKNSGILQNFCRHWSVVALDLSVKANYEQLLHAIRDLSAAGQVTLPFKALVTPSASGFAVISSLQGNLSTLTSLVQSWIPVACNSLLLVDTSTLIQLNGWPIFAIYGDRDLSGKRSSELLKQYSGAIVQELSGRHPCYLDSPLEFVDTINDFLNGIE